MQQLDMEVSCGWLPTHLGDDDDDEEEEFGEVHRNVVPCGDGADVLCNFGDWITR
jgi:hypothetical protein